MNGHFDSSFLHFILNMHNNLYALKESFYNLHWRKPIGAFEQALFDSRFKTPEEVLLASLEEFKVVLGGKISDHAHDRLDMLMEDFRLERPFWDNRYMLWDMLRLTFRGPCALHCDSAITNPVY